MVEYSVQLDAIFHSLADPIRRDILQSVIDRDQTITELARRYNVSFAAVSKHITVLERARLIRKKKEGRTAMVALQPATLQQADTYLERYRQQAGKTGHKTIIQRRSPIHAKNYSQPMV